MDGRRDRLALSLDSIWYGRSGLRWLLVPLGLAYRLAVTLRRWLYSRGLLHTERLAVPVIVVGNLTAGGTGKTPITIWLARELGRRGRRVAIVCRGYRGRAASWPQEVSSESDPHEVGDEAVLLAKRTGCPVVAAPDRVAAAKLAMERHRVDVILSDDGLQHYRLGRSLELVVIDGERGLGNGWCLPAGPLREPATRLREVDAVIVNGGDFGHAGVMRSRVEAGHVYELASGIERRLSDFEGRRVHAVAGIGNPGRFFSLLERAGLIVTGHRLADHADITEENLRFGDSSPIFVTEKDAVKCRSFAGAGVWCVVADVEFAARDDERLMGLVARQIESEAA